MVRHSVAKRPESKENKKKEADTRSSEWSLQVQHLIAMVASPDRNGAFCLGEGMEFVECLRKASLTKCHPCHLHLQSLANWVSVK